MGEWTHGWVGGQIGGAIARGRDNVGLRGGISTVGWRALVRCQSEHIAALTLLLLVPPRKPATSNLLLHSTDAWSCPSSLPPPICLPRMAAHHERLDAARVVRGAAALALAEKGKQRGGGGLGVAQVYELVPVVDKDVAGWVHWRRRVAPRGRGRGACSGGGGRAAECALCTCAA